MSRAAMTLAVFLTIAGVTQAQSNETASFFGPERTWKHARVELHDVHGLWGGQAIYVEGSGRCVVQLVDKSRKSRVWHLKLQANEAQTILEQAIEQDLYTLKIEDRMGVPDEARHRLVLANGRERIHRVDKWENDKVPRFDRIVKALKALIAKTKDRKPDAAGEAFDPKWRPWSAIQVTVHIYSGRPNPTFELTDPADWKAVRDRLPTADAAKESGTASSRLGYSGFALRGRQMPDFPLVGVDAIEGVIRLRGAHKDEKGLEKWLLAKAREKGIQIPK